LLLEGVQELVSCTPNPKACGGNGGCTGSTAEIAYDWVAQHGIIEEWRFGYQSFHGEVVNCTIIKPETTNVVPKTIDGAVASIVGFSNLPTNSYNALMYAVAMQPVVVAVAANAWGLYKGGIFDDDDQPNRIINHAVILEGYGKDEETGQLYWIIRNSWGPKWGENGRIRLKRIDPSTLEDPQSDCKMDTEPADGIACTKDDDGKNIKPKNAQVCGTSGVLYDGVIPVGGHLL
jgi:cathepsin L